MNMRKVLLIAGTATIVGLAAFSGTAFAWHPKGIITKKVQNITAASTLTEADTAAQAVAAKPGDTLKYVIEIRNDGTPDERGWNDMAKTVMTDTLPAGIELASNPAQRQITENIGLIKPGQKITKEYAVKVTATQNGTIQNTACFTGNSTANDNPQQGCNPAVIKVTVPPVEPPVVAVPPTPVTSVAEIPTELPKTGISESIILGIFAFSTGIYAVKRYLTSRRELTAVFLTRR